jgi:hypothetical protein
MVLGVALLQMKLNKIASISIVVVFVAVIAIAIPSVYVTVMDSITIGSTGSIKAIGVGVYWDSSCTNEVTSLDWSIIEAGSSDTKMVYIKNAGNTAAILSLDTGNWNPSNAADYISLAWNYDGLPIAVDDVAQVTLTLTISSSISGITNFSFDIIVSASS